MPELIKGTCVHCDGHIEFSPEQVEEIAACPHCEKETVLRKTVEYRVDVEKSRAFWRKLVTAALTLAAIVAVFAGLTILAHGLASTAGGVGNLIGGAMGAVLGCIAIFLVALWVVFPFVVYR